MALEEVSLEEMGFKKAEKPQNKNEDDVDKALDIFDRVIIPKKIAEAKRFNDILEETGGDISKQEMNELLGYGFANELLGDKPIPLNTKPMERVYRAREKENTNQKTTSTVEEEQDDITSILNSIDTGFDFDEDDI